jgi:glycine cleavage system H protein
VYAPIAGSIVAVNEDLAEDPEKINVEPYGEGWIVRVQPGEEIDESELMTPDAYQQLVDELDE